jgi:hypothetical protein
MSIWTMHRDVPDDTTKDAPILRQRVNLLLTLLHLVHSPFRRYVPNRIRLNRLLNVLYLETRVATRPKPLQG